MAFDVRTMHACSAGEYAVGVRRCQFENQACIVDHRLSIFVPAFVLAHNGAVIRNELINSVVARCRCDRRQLDIGFDHNIGPEVVAIYMQARTRIATQILGLGSTVCDGN